MRQPHDAVREHLVRVLDWEDAHVTFDKAVAGIPPETRGTRPPGFEHSSWQLLEHIRIAQDDILDFCVNATYEHNLTWPDDYWPPTPAPADAATVPTGKANQIYLRAILLAADQKRRTR